MIDVLATAVSKETAELQEMMAYHLGFENYPASSGARGKRVRPLLVLLTCGAIQAEAGNWQKAVPSAAAVELLHNFSLIHDDIQDNSDLRRGRPTVWKRWGIPQAINAGDAMYSLAFRALQGQAGISGPETGLAAHEIFQETCLALTRGQYLDISFEDRTIVSLDEYWSMIAGKTAALIATCTDLGALAGGASAERRTAFRNFGLSLGLAFQVQDDLLGIWGDETVTGKSAGGDLVAGKKSLPVIFGLTQNGEFAKRWHSGPIQPDEAADLARQLFDEGARAHTEAQSAAQTRNAMRFLEEAEPRGAIGELLAALAVDLLHRNL